MWWWGVLAEVSQCFLDAEAVSLSRAVAVTTAAPPVVKLQARTGWAALQAGSAFACEKKKKIILFFPIFLKYSSYLTLELTFSRQPPTLIP